MSEQAKQSTHDGVEVHSKIPLRNIASTITTHVNSEDMCTMTKVLDLLFELLQLSISFEEETIK